MKHLNELAMECSRGVVVFRVCQERGSMNELPSEFADNTDPRRSVVVWAFGGSEQVARRLTDGVTSSDGEVASLAEGVGCHDSRG